MTDLKAEIYPDGPCFSRLIYGTWRILDTTEKSLASPDEILKKIKHCLSLGISTFDLADIYGGGEHQAEKAFGQALAKEPSLRSQMQLVTKCGIVVPGATSYPNVGCSSTIQTYSDLKLYDTSKEYIKRRVEESLEAVGCVYFDLVLIHRPDPFMNATDVAQAMSELKDEGKVKYFGVSNFKPDQLDLLQSRLSFPLVTNQIEMSVVRTIPLYDGTLDQAQKLGMSPMIWSPLAGGSIFKESSDDKISRLKKCLDKIAKKHGKAVSTDQIALAWLFAHPSRPYPILGTNDMNRITSAVMALDIKLSRQDWFEILEASNGKRVP